MCIGTYPLGDKVIQCSCPSCVGVVRAEYYITSPYYNGEAWHRDIPKRKPRRIVLISAVWQHVIDFEDWVYPIHTIACSQSSVRHGFLRLRMWGDQPPESAQGRLSLMD